MNIQVVLLYILIIVCMFSVYFFPSIVSILRKKENTPAIITLNILTGWTFIGWIISLVWSLTKDD